MPSPSTINTVVNTIQNRQEVSEKSVTRVGHKWWNDGMLIHSVRSSWGEGKNSHLTKHPDYYYAPDHTGIFGITCMYQLHEGLSGSTHA